MGTYISRHSGILPNIQLYQRLFLTFKQITFLDHNTTALWQGTKNQNVDDVERLINRGS